MTSVTQLGYLGIGVSDIVAWEEYATNGLGLQVSGRQEDGTLLLRMDEYHSRFILHPSGEDDLIFTGWAVKDRPALDEVAARVRASGVEVEEGDPAAVESRHVLGLIKFKDPAGLDTEVFYGPCLDNPHPFNSPRGLSGFETGEAGSMGLGHIVVGVANAEITRRFYTDVLGLRISDYIDLTLGPKGPTLRFVFLHCNPRHHSIAFGGPRNPGAGPATLGGPGRKRLNHFMLQVKQLDEVGITYNMVEEMGMNPGKLGRHTNDHMFSFYSDTPSGFQVEYGYGGLHVDDEKWQVQYYRAASIWGHDFGPQPPPPSAAPAASAASTAGP